MTQEALVTNGGQSTFTNPEHTHECSISPLTPFKYPHHTQRANYEPAPTFWNSEDLRDWTLLGYSQVPPLLNPCNMGANRTQLLMVSNSPPTRHLLLPGKEQ
jgi:hypothetical protein